MIENLVKAAGFMKSVLLRNYIFLTITAIAMFSLSYIGSSSMKPSLVATGIMTFATYVALACIHKIRDSLGLITHLAAVFLITSILFTALAAYSVYDSCQKAVVNNVDYSGTCVAYNSSGLLIGYMITALMIMVSVYGLMVIYKFIKFLWLSVTKKVRAPREKSYSIKNFFKYKILGTQDHTENEGTENKKDDLVGSDDTARNSKVKDPEKRELNEKKKKLNKARKESRRKNQKGR